MTARIYKPARTATQSGKAKTTHWILEHEPTTAKYQEPLMGWTGNADMKRQVKLRFESREEAIAYARREGLAYRVVEPPKKVFQPKSYSDNFSARRKAMWTH